MPKTTKNKKKEIDLDSLSEYRPIRATNSWDRYYGDVVALYEEVDDSYYMTSVFFPMHIAYAIQEACDDCEEIPKTLKAVLKSSTKDIRSNGTLVRMSVGDAVDVLEFAGFDVL